MTRPELVKLIDENKYLSPDEKNYILYHHKFTPEAKERLKKWVAELRSGKYAQITGFLFASIKDGSIGFCCLGVYCHGVESMDATQIYLHLNVPKSSNFPLRPVQSFFQTLNDENGYDFEQIADVIEIAFLAE